MKPLTTQSLIKNVKEPPAAAKDCTILLTNLDDELTPTKAT